MTDAAILLEAVRSQAPHRFRPIPGAPEIFAFLERRGWRVAMATGAWRPSALVKLSAAGIPHEGIPLASASDHWARAEIIRRAVAAVSSEAAPVVYVGDGVWDGRAARALDHAFLGVASGARAQELRDAGRRSRRPGLHGRRGCARTHAATVPVKTNQRGGCILAERGRAAVGFVRYAPEPVGTSTERRSSV